MEAMLVTLSVTNTGRCFSSVWTKYVVFIVCRAMSQGIPEERTIQQLLQGLPFQVPATLALRTHQVYHSHIQLAMPSHLVVVFMYHLPSLLQQSLRPVLAILLDVQLHHHMSRHQRLLLV